MKIEELITSIREDISKNQVESAIHKLKGLFNRTTQLYEVIIQESRHNDLKKQIRYGTIEFSKSNIEKNRIKKSLLDIVQEIHYVQKLDSNVRGELNNLDLKELNKLSIDDERNWYLRILKINVLYAVAFIIGVILLTFFTAKNSFISENQYDLNGFQNDVANIHGAKNDIIQGNENQIGDNIITSYYLQGDSMVLFTKNEKGDTISINIKKVNRMRKDIENHLKMTESGIHLNNAQESETTKSCEIKDYRYFSSGDYIEFYEKNSDRYKFIAKIGIYDIHGTAIHKKDKIYLSSEYGKSELLLSNNCKKIRGSMSGMFGDTQVINYSLDY